LGTHGTEEKFVQYVYIGKKKKLERKRLVGVPRQR